jgi:hypothetical protein
MQKKKSRLHTTKKNQTKQGSTRRTEEITIWKKWYKTFRKNSKIAKVSPSLLIITLNTNGFN